MLEQIANEYINGNKVEKPKNVTVIDVHDPNEIHVKNDNTIVQFYTDGKGLVLLQHIMVFTILKITFQQHFKMKMIN